MKSKIKTLVSSVKARPKTSIVVLIVLVLIIGSILKKSAPTVESIVVSRGTVTQEVAVTGKTVSVHDVELGFDKGGKIASAPVTVGTRVSVGSVLATLDNSELKASLLKAKADLAEETVKLNQVRQQSGDSFMNARSNMIGAIRDSYVKSDDAIRNTIDKFFKNAGQSSTYIEFVYKDGSSTHVFPVDSNLRVKINSERYKIEQILVSWQKSLTQLSETSDLGAFATEAETTLNRIKSFLDMVALVANSLESSTSAHDATISGFKTDVADARSEVATAFSNLITTREEYSTAPRVIGSGQDQNYDDVLAEEAKVAQFEAAIASVEAQISATVISSPIDGIVTKQNAKQGQIVSAGEKLISVISDKNMEIEANVSEVNIGKVAIGNQAVITFDAYPGKSFTGKVFYIEPAETIIDNVVNYKIKVSIDEDIAELKSGLTANLSLVTALRENVIKIPKYAIFEEGGKTVIHSYIGSDFKIIPVTVGLVGNDGSVEIVSGLTEGEILKIDLVK